MSATATGPRHAASLPARLPKGRRELAAHQRAQTFGARLGADFPNIHAPIDDQRYMLAQHAIPRAQALAKWIGIETRVWIALLSISALLNIALIAVAWFSRQSRPDARLLLVWVVFTVAWLIAYLVGRARGRAAAAKRGRRFSWLADVISVSAGTVIIERRIKAGEHDPSDRQGEFASSSPAPPPLPYGVSEAGASGLVAAWMRHLGEVDAAAVSESIVGSLHYIAGVLNEAEPVGAEAIQTFAGQSLIESRRPLVFAASSYSEEAVAYANRVAIALFAYDAVNGNLAGRNSLAADLIRTGL